MRVAVMKSRFTLRALSAVMLASALLFPTLGGAAAADRTDVVVIQGGGGDPGTWDIVNSGISDTTRPIYLNVIEPLLYLKEDGTLAPGLAETWSVSDDGLTLTFHLREAKFHNGDPLNSAAVLFSMEAMKGSPVARSRRPFAIVDSIEAPDDRTVVITLTRPSRSFLRSMAERQGMVHAPSAYANIAQKPVGTGPYMVDEYVQDSHLRLVRNPNYWGEAPAMESVTIRFIPDATSAINAMLAGEADAYLGMSPETYERIGTQKLDEVFRVTAVGEGASTGILRLNRFAGPMKDLRIRQAVAYALDREDLIAIFGADFAFKPICTYGTVDLPWVSPASPESCVYPGPDREKAAALLKEAGYDGTPIVFSYINTWTEGEIIAAQLEAAGFVVQRDPRERSNFSTTIIGVVPPPTDINMTYTSATIDQFATPDPNANYTYTQDFNDLVVKAESTSNDEDYVALMTKANRLLQEDAVVIAFASRFSVGIMSQDLAGWEERFYSPGELSYDFADVSWKE
jgi:peptide/nickel transport system substrate-binding protein